MQKLFSPSSIAVIGASSNPDKLGHIISKNIIESKYAGRLYLINPGAQNVLGQEVYNSLDQIKEVVDLSIIVIPSKSVLEALKQIGEQKVATNNQDTTFAIIISAGFRELGIDGVEEEKRLLDVAKKFNIRLLGPNCLGVMNLSGEKYRYNGTFDYSPSMTGNISLVSQSGALISAMIEQADSLGFGFNKIVSLGNKCDINENDIVSFLEQDETTEVIALYLESFSAGKSFYESLKKITKPVVILKAGRDQAAKTAASSHTGSIAGDQRVAEAFLGEAMAEEVFSLDEFFDTLSLLSNYKPIEHNNLIVCTNAGGLGVIALDGLTGLDLKLQSFDENLTANLAKVLPIASGLHNPVDVLGDADSLRYNFALTTVLDAYPNANLLIILTPQANTEVLKTAEILCELKSKYPKSTLLPVFLGGQAVESGLEEFKKAKLPFFESPERALKALSNLWASSHQAKVTNDSLSTTPVSNTQKYEINRQIEENIQKKHKILDFKTINKIAEVYGINTPMFVRIDKINQLNTVFDSLGTPVVVKSINTDILHRTEKKAVITGVTNVNQITDFLDENDLKDVIFQESIDRGVEVFVGINVDPNFGQVIVVGTGGIYAEVMDDFALAPLPQNIDQVKQVFEKTKISKILSNYRNITLNSEGLFNLILGICQFARDYPKITSIDANPIIVTTDNCYAVDLKLSLI